MQTLEGTTLGRYHLQHLIGHGGMAEVYLADDELLHREVAIKIVHHYQGNDLARFQREAEMVGPLVHEHILPAFDYGQEGPLHYLVMPYISHGTLADRLQTRGPLNQAEAGVLLEQIASALQYAHDRGILHRDIKPSNILLRDDTYVYLADFGIARSLEQGSDLTETGTIIGTPEYMAPELIDKPASQSSDIYALGVVLYYMLAGHLPFTAPNPVAVFEKQLRHPPPRLSALNPAISPLIENTVFCALAKDPQQRFQTPLALANAYNQALQGQPTPTSPLHANLAFYTDTTIASSALPSLPPGPQSARPVGQAARLPRNTAFFIALGILALILVLLSVLATNMPNNHGGNQAAAQIPATASPTVKPTATPGRTPVTQNKCTVNDTNGILERGQICQAAQNLTSSLIVNVSQNKSSGDGNAYRIPRAVLTPDPHTIIIYITLSQQHGYERTQIGIIGGSEVPLSDEQYHAAANAFYWTLNSGDYTTATITAIQVLQADGA